MVKMMEGFVFCIIIWAARREPNNSIWKCVIQNIRWKEYKHLLVFALPQDVEAGNVVLVCTLFWVWTMLLSSTNIQASGVVQPTEPGIKLFRQANVRSPHLAAALGLTSIFKSQINGGSSTTVGGLRSTFAAGGSYTVGFDGGPFQ